MSDAPIEVPLFDVRLGEREQQAARATLEEGWLTMGPRTRAFEEAFAAATGARHVIAVSSGTAALHASLLALDLGPGDEVICPSLTFVATANAIRYVGATPVFCDIVGTDDLNLDPEDVAQRVTERTRAVIAVHFAGYPAALDQLRDLCERHDLHLVEDSAHACISRREGRATGTWGVCGCFSFFSNKNITCGEGGAITTDDDGIEERLRLIRSHGMTTGTVDRHRGRALSYDVVELGHNFRLDELRGAILTVQLERLPEYLERRAQLVQMYRERLGGLGVDVPRFGLPEGREFTKSDRVAHHLQCVLLPEGTDRDQVMVHMRRCGVQTSIHYPPVHQLSSFARGGAMPRLPRTEQVAARELTLPLFPGMSEAQLDRVCESLSEALEQGEHKP